MTLSKASDTAAAIAATSGQFAVILRAGFYDYDAREAFSFDRVQDRDVVAFVYPGGRRLAFDFGDDTFDPRDES